MILPNSPSDGPVRSTQHPHDKFLIQWPDGPQTPRLLPGQVHVWAADVSEFAGRLAELGQMLSGEENIRSDKFKFADDRDQFRIRRALLRLILSRYVAKTPSGIAYRHGEFGKPELDMDGRPPELFFNTSHSSRIAACAITSACPIGIDVERIAEIPEIKTIADRFFRPRETETLMSLPADSRLLAFYNCWTRKEAVLKTTGEGIARNLENIEVTLAPDDAPRVAAFSGDKHAGQPWHLQPFSPAPEYIGCVAYRNSAMALNQWRLAESHLQYSR
jgi:4'-phosphopantetheinyl transferase